MILDSISKSVRNPPNKAYKLSYNPNPRAIYDTQFKD